MYFLPVTPETGPSHSKKHRLTAKEALCDTLFVSESGRCPTKR